MEKYIKSDKSRKSTFYKKKHDNMSHNEYDHKSVTENTNKNVTMMKSIVQMPDDEIFSNMMGSNLDEQIEGHDGYF